MCQVVSSFINNDLELENIYKYSPELALFVLTYRKYFQTMFYKWYRRTKLAIEGYSLVFYFINLSYHSAIFVKSY